MGFSELAVMLLVYGGLMAYFIMPFKEYYQGELTFAAALKKSAVKTIFHKKLIFAIIFLSLVLFSIWQGFAQSEGHINAHSGYEPISTNVSALYSMLGVFAYTICIYVLIVFVKTLKIIKAN